MPELLISLNNNDPEEAFFNELKEMLSEDSWKHFISLWKVNLGKKRHYCLEYSSDKNNYIAFAHLGLAGIHEFQTIRNHNQDFQLNIATDLVLDGINFSINDLINSFLFITPPYDTGTKEIFEQEDYIFEYLTASPPVIIFLFVEEVSEVSSKIITDALNVVSFAKASRKIDVIAIPVGQQSNIPIVIKANLKIIAELLKQKSSNETILNSFPGALHFAQKKQHVHYDDENDISYIQAMNAPFGSFGKAGSIPGNTDENESDPGISEIGNADWDDDITNIPNHTLSIPFAPFEEAGSTPENTAENESHLEISEIGNANWDGTAASVNEDNITNEQNPPTSPDYENDHAIFPNRWGLNKIEPSEGFTNPDLNKTVFININTQKKDTPETDNDNPPSTFKLSKKIFNYGIPSPPIESPRDEQPTDEVTCTVYSPKKITLGSEFLIQAFIHTEQQTAELDKLATSADEDTERRAAARLIEKIAIGTKLDLQLMMDDFIIDEPVISLKWDGKINSAQFIVKTPAEYQHNAVFGRIIVLENSIPIGQLKFKITVIEKNTDADVEGRNSSSMVRFKQAFISYASPDRNEVLKRVQMLNLARIKFFQDLLTLEPGEEWEKLIYDYINTSDVFFLFWSKAASESPWVKKELLHALEIKKKHEEALPEIIPVIIEGPPPAKPPEELSFLHFNDKFIYFMQ